MSVVSLPARHNPNLNQSSISTSNSLSTTISSLPQPSTQSSSSTPVDPTSSNKSLPAQSPSKCTNNPFARPKLTLESTSFTRSTLLPGLTSPVRELKPKSSTLSNSHPTSGTRSESEPESAAGTENVKLSSNPNISASSNTLDDPMTTPHPASGGGKVNESVVQHANSDFVGSANGVGSASRPRSSWRLLWRGGLEVGNEGWRLEGLTFFALLEFPSTPSASNINPFDSISNNHTSTPLMTRTATTSDAITANLNTGNLNGLGASPFALPSADTDLCLSLESMRGRKWLQVRGAVELPEDEILEGDDGGVQMSISPHAHLLAAYFTQILCRDAALSNQGRTLTAITIGLGDEGVDTEQNTLLIYGQKQTSSDPDELSYLRLCVARRRAPRPTAPSQSAKVRPGEPLPRSTLFFPVKAPIRPLPPIPRRSLAPSRSFSRATSVSSIYAPPVQPSTKELPPAPVSGRTPGRRGEKRPRPFTENESMGHDGRSLRTDKDMFGGGPGKSAVSGGRYGDRRRQTGKIVLESGHGRDKASQAARQGSAVSIGGEAASRISVSSKDITMTDGHTHVRQGRQAVEEDIFGRRMSMSMSTTASLMTISSAKAEEGTNQDEGSSSGRIGSGGAGGSESGTGELDLPSSAARGKRIRVPQQVLDNKATLLLLEMRGYSREHEIFKDVFRIVTKGAYFAFRDQLESGPLDKGVIQDIVERHLDMYLIPSLSTFSSTVGRVGSRSSNESMATFMNTKSSKPRDPGGGKLKKDEEKEDNDVREDEVDDDDQEPIVKIDDEEIVKERGDAKLKDLRMARSGLNESSLVKIEEEEDKGEGKGKEELSSEREKVDDKADVLVKIEHVEQIEQEI